MGLKVNQEGGYGEVQNKLPGLEPWSSLRQVHGAGFRNLP